MLTETEISNDEKLMIDAASGTLPECNGHATLQSVPASAWSATGDSRNTSA